jgi:hypothetical protein
MPKLPKVAKKEEVKNKELKMKKPPKLKNLDRTKTKLRKLRLPTPNLRRPNPSVSRESSSSPPV